jgi:hypothetical protein
MSNAYGAFAEKNDKRYEAELIKRLINNAVSGSGSIKRFGYFTESLSG